MLGYFRGWVNDADAWNVLLEHSQLIKYEIKAIEIASLTENCYVSGKHTHLYCLVSCP